MTDERTAAAPAMAGDLAAGDVISELDTPDGPWMRVVEADRERRVLLVAVEDLDEPVEIPVGSWTDSVLRRERDQPTRDDVGPRP